MKRIENKLKVVVVGCGMIADGHVSEIQKIESAILLAVCDIEPIMAEQLAKRLNVPHFFSDYEEMLEKLKPDVVHICTPPATHLMLTKKAVDAGCHVYVEKPLEISYVRCLELVNYVQMKNKKITIGHNSEFDPPSIELNNLIDAGKLGRPVHIDSWFGYDLGGGFGKAIMSSPNHWVHKLPGKIFQNNINHMLNKITKFIDDEKPKVKAMAWRDNHNRTFGDERDCLFDELRVVIKGKDVSGYGSFSANVRPVVELSRVYGTNSIINLDYVSRVVTVDKGVTIPSAIGRLASGFSKTKAHANSCFRNTKNFLKSEYHFFSGMSQLISRFYSSILENTTEPIPPRKMLQIAWIMDEIFSQINEEMRGLE